MAKASPQGFRQNNPGNIEATKIVWRGEVVSKTRFEKFESPLMGLRALFKLLLNYHKAGYNTIRKIIARWAPPHENHTNAYIASVESLVMVGKDQILDIGDDETLIRLAQGIVRQENGANKEEPFWYPVELYSEALALARGKK